MDGISKPAPFQGDFAFIRTTELTHDALEGVHGPAFGYCGTPVVPIINAGATIGAGWVAPVIDHETWFAVMTEMNAAAKADWEDPRVASSSDGFLSY